MGFTTPCFIRKNTEELRKKLEEIGYAAKFSTKDHDVIYAEATSGVYFTMFSSNISQLMNFAYDCGENEALFLAIAALRDDTDKNQWFTDGYLWFECGDEMCDETIEYYLNEYGRKFHKATVEELINHFK